MKNDIIGSFGIIILAMILFLFAGNSLNQSNLSWLSPNTSQETVEGAEPIEETDGEKNQALWPFLNDEINKKYGQKKNWAVKTIVGEGMYWPQEKNKTEDAFVYVGVQGVNITQPHDSSGQTLNDFNKWLNKKMKQLGFKQVKLGPEKCKTSLEGGAYSDCVIAWERGKNERCLETIVYATDPEQLEPATVKQVQVKLKCGQIP